MSGSDECSGSVPQEDDECGPGGANGMGVIACAQTVVARRDGLRDRRSQRSRRLTAQRKLKGGPCRAKGVMVSGVRSAGKLFATKAQGKLHHKMEVA
jgi:hypothetical protein